MPTLDQWDKMTRQAVQEVNARMGLVSLPPATGLSTAANAGTIGFSPASYSSPQGGATTGMQPQGYKDGGVVQPDYDYFRHGKEIPQGQHGPDEFKLPNHTTFSDESRYSTPETPGGQWRPEGVRWGFTPSGYNLTQHTPSEIALEAGGYGANVNLPPMSYGSPMERGVMGLATGGVVPGHGRGDHIPIMAEPGEIVIPKDVVDHKGREYFLNLIEKTQEALGLRSSQQKPTTKQGIRGYANGGLIEGDDPTKVEAPGPMTEQDLPLYDSQLGLQQHPSHPETQAPQGGSTYIVPESEQMQAPGKIQEEDIRSGNYSPAPILTMSPQQQAVRQGLGNERRARQTMDEIQGVGITPAVLTKREDPAGSEQRLVAGLQGVVDEGYPRMPLTTSSHRGGAALYGALNQMPGTGSRGKFFANSPEEFIEGRDRYNAANQQLSDLQLYGQTGLMGQAEGMGRQRAAQDIGIYASSTGDKATDAIIQSVMAPLIQEEMMGGVVSQERKQRAVETALALATRNGKAGGGGNMITADGRPVITKGGKRYAADDDGNLQEYSGEIWPAGSNPYNDYTRSKYLELQEQHPDWTPQQLRREAGKAWDATQQGNKTQLIEIRNQGYLEGVDRRNATSEHIADERNDNLNKRQLYDVIDPDTYEPVKRTRQQIVDASAQGKEYLPAVIGERQIAKASRFREIATTSKSVRSMTFDPEIQQLYANPKLAAKVVLLIKDNDRPLGPVKTLIRQRLGRTFTPKQQEYIIWLASMKESVNALQGLGGIAGSGSDTLRRSIAGMIPSEITPSAEYARKQIDVFDVELRNLAGGLLRTPPPPEERTPQAAPQQRPQGLQPTQPTQPKPQQATGKPFEVRVVNGVAMVKHADGRREKLSVEEAKKRGFI